MKPSVVTVFGGSGFVGRHLVKRLADAGYIVRVAVRDSEAALFLKVCGDAGQVVPWPADITRPEQVASAVDGADVVVNLVGILFEFGRQKFDVVHRKGAQSIATACRAAGVGRLVHMSAIGCEDDAPSQYGRSKAAGCQAVREIFPDATIVRPSVIFGAEDNFFNLFAGLSRLTWVLPVFGCPVWPEVKLFPDGGFADIDLYGDGGTRMQPVYVGDVAEAIVKICADAATAGHTYDLGGPTVYSFKEIMGLLLAITGRRRFLAPIPFPLATFVAWFLEWWPKPILTRDQVQSLTRDNVVSGKNPGFKDLDISPIDAETILPTYLHRFRTPARQEFFEA
ncbi:MAG: complex I NDUFA9 subunit family protein [Alphaproteobacteria bacterium]|nr:complex I NDUFA9 subunit family protein [Alphaproteobacteria bacterium]MBT7944077.1 complex I NDUFA9 subunit family protein [Alphaproteobacteria bacterium]